MSGSIGDAAVLEGAFTGLDRGLDRRERAKQRDHAVTQREHQLERQAREKQTWANSDAERKHQMERREITEKRADQAYEISETQRIRRKTGGDALRKFMVKGDISGVNDFLNTNDPEVDYNLQKGKDGKYIMTMTDKKTGKSGSNANVSIDDIGKTLHALMSVDPVADLGQELARGRSAAALADERKHDITKLREEYKLKAGIERIKAGGTVGKGGKSLPAYEKQFASLAKSYYGSLDDSGAITFDSTRKRRMSATHPHLATAIYYSTDVDTNGAHNAAAQMMTAIEEQAVGIVDAELEAGKITKRQYESRVSDVIDALATNAIDEMAPSPAQTLNRQGGAQGEAQAQSQSQPQGQPQGQPQAPPPEALQILKQDPSPEAKAEFDEVFGAGAADKALGGSSQDQGAQVDPQAGVQEQGDDALHLKDDESDADMLARMDRELAGTNKKRSDLRDSEIESILKRKPDTGSPRSKQSRGRKVLAEFKANWDNLNPDQKSTWWANNSSLLKKVAPRVWRKASQEMSGTTAVAAR